MGTVTYKKQPGIHKTRGSVPLAGTAHVYTVSELLWPTEVEEFIITKLIGTVLHVCCGRSQIGNTRLDLYEKDIDVRANMTRLPFTDCSYDSVLIDPPYNSRFQIMHDMLNEIHRIARKRIVFQHWFSPVNKDGQFKKAHVFHLSELVAIIDPATEKAEPAKILYDGGKTEDALLVKEVSDGDPFILVEKYAWQPRSYFGRMQFISIFDRGE